VIPTTLLVSYIRVIGCKTYILIEKEKYIILEKLILCTEVSILVGFKGHYIYCVYIPLKRRVIRTSHCRFDEGQGLITESNNTDLSLLDRSNIRGDSQGNQDFEDTGISPS
jgi:DNA-binding XRE family transcriptional regulator